MRRVSTGSTNNHSSFMSSIGRGSFKHKKHHSLSSTSPPKNELTRENSKVNMLSHIRTPSDPADPGVIPIYAQVANRSSGHWRNRSGDNHNSSFNGGSKPTPAPKTNLNGSYSSSTSSSASKHYQQQVQQQPVTSSTQILNSTPNTSSALYASLQRPRVPPPPLPPHQTKTTPLRTNSNGLQEDGMTTATAYPAMDSDDTSQIRSAIPLPVPPPRRVSFI